MRLRIPLPRVLQASRKQIRRGLTQIEVIGSAALVATVITVLACMGAQLQRVAKDSRNYQIAVHELANQIDYLRSLPQEQQSDAMHSLKVSENTAQSLIDANLNAEVISDRFGSRVILSLQWERIGHPEPVRMVGWLNTDPSEGNPSTDQGGTQ